jgi:aryl-alcohol dehydrogenase-like predicted oxidoreductase
MCESKHAKEIMQEKQLGQSGIDIAPIVFGGNVLGWTTDTKRSFELLDRCVERGFNTVDTADVYSAFAPGHSGGESEEVLGRWLAQRGRRDDIILMSKVGMLEQRKGLSAGNIEGAVEDSLRRLGTDYLDVYFAHIDDQDVPLEDTLGAFGRLVDKGKVRALGASNYSAARTKQALELSEKMGLPRYEVLQPEYNLYDRAGFETDLAGLAEEKALGVVGYSALASGFLTGKHLRIEDLSDRPRAQFITRYFDERGKRVLQGLLEAAAALQAKPAQIALAWLMARRGITAPIVSATSIEQLDELLDAVNVVIPEEWMTRLEAASG